MLRWKFNLADRREPMPRKAKTPRKAPKTRKAPAATKDALNAKKGKRYTPKEKKALLDKWVEQRQAGQSAVAAAKALGVPYITLSGWAKKSGLALPRQGKGGRKPGRKPGKAKAIQTLQKAVKPTRGRKLEAAPLAGGLTLVTPAGFRIEGIETADLIRVLQALR
jgi:hypothetical protein